ncbi:Uncharacterised protein [Amycolatopsis camponoti]|uniref:Uncharacterized protein n=1 Tax=Amycolatopsis camponoti TaxID=2606593 RepID=A0A6I8M078_9PSEU|nr:SAVMC3_10250 family protein [Amycolatopsis camponoti]VVJ21325.1 Uncharacterised protein [Amycolatopsis camponoti]
MRELVYVSDAKLRQVLPGLPKASAFRGLEGSLELKGPVSTGAKFEKKASKETDQSLRKAVDVLEKSSRAPSWFADPDVRPGTWTHFEAPMAYRVLSLHPGEALVFVDVDAATPEYPTGGRLRLLLHGSAHHLLETRSGSERESERLRGSRWHEFAEMMRLFLTDDAAAKDPDAAKTIQDYSEFYASRIWEDVRNLTRTLQPGYTAAWMAGYARVTARIPTADGVVLAASPLYVEHIDSPGSGG